MLENALVRVVSIAIMAGAASIFYEWYQGYIDGLVLTIVTALSGIFQI